MHAGYLFMTLLFADFFLNFNFLFQKVGFRSIIRVSNGLDPDQDQHSVGPDLDPKCLRRVTSRQEKSPKQVKS